MWKKYRKKPVLVEMAKWTPDFDMTDVSVSKADRDNGHPKEGDMIARDSNNHDDVYLVNKEWFENHYETKPQ